MQLFGILAGAVLLLAGRRLFWLFVGLMGFFAGMALAGQYFSETTALIVGVVLGVIVAILAVSVSRFGLAIAGFLAGGYFLTSLIGMFNTDSTALYWVLFVVGGILGAVLIAFVFDWALIVLSSLSGAVMVTRALDLAQPLGLIVLVILVVVGIIVQARSKDER